ncbi:hypothetical protein [Vulcanisaeta distributa]|uniref:hypothetical protein n=1 Tax=Vulcanisaeta distributa TaxID=164451 RepID=UPI000A9E5DA7|nr:hypothetical protein [Vulcanisaeta distributa]
MNLKYVIAIAVITIAVAVIGAVFALRILYKPTGPTFNELFTYTSNNTYTANYNYYIYSNIAGQVSTESYLFTYSQRGGPTDRYIVVTTTSAPQMSLYIVTTELSNGTIIQCIVEPLYAGCSSTNQTFNLVYLALPHS